MSKAFFLLLSVFAIFFSSLDGVQRSTSYPFLSGDTWRFFCDWRLSDKEGFNPKEVKTGDSIFVEYDSLDEFFNTYLPKISSKFILVTPNCENGSDNPLPGRFEKCLNSHLLAFWFLQNLDREICPKIVPIPIGLANTIHGHGDINILSRYIEEAKQRELNGSSKSHIAYINFSIQTNAKARQPCYDYFERQSFSYIAPLKRYEDYLKDLLETIFVISPPGNGLDCHRTWEALLMGCYPVVLSSTLNPLYEGLPVVIVERWEQVTYEFLEYMYCELSVQSYSTKTLYAPYWLSKLTHMQNELRNE